MENKNLQRKTVSTKDPVRRGPPGRLLGSGYGTFCVWEAGGGGGGGGWGGELGGGGCGTSYREWGGSL